MRFTLKMTLIACLAMAAAPNVADAQGRWQPGDGGSFRVFLGEFKPDGNSEYWDDKFADFTGSISDFKDFIFLGDYRMPVASSSSVLFGMSWYEGSSTQAYLEWVDASGRDIRHLTSLREYDLTAAWIYEIGARRKKVTPYFGAGVGYLWWELVESGDFIDFSDDDLPVFSTTYGSTGDTFEFFGVVGVDIRLGHAFSLVLQGRWREADDNLGGSMAGLGTIDLAGFDYELGVAFHF